MNPGKKPSPAPPKKKKKKPSIVSSEASSSISIEAPRGCLRFFLSHSSSSNLKTPLHPRPRLAVLSKTPKSAPPRNPLKTAKLMAMHSIDDSKSATVTPLLCKKAQEEEEASNKIDGTTPPVQASVSPEIQLGSSSAVSSASLACYAAGHVLSGITDKRKCRPRGILNAGDNAKALCSFDDEDDDHGSAPTVFDASLVPLPTEASMHWLLSPCKEEDEDHKEHSEPAASFHVPVSSAPASEAPPLTDETQYIYDFDAENSPFSMASLSSGNVILTPQSDSSADANVGRSQYYESELNSVAEAIRMASLSPDHHELIEHQIDSSFEFDCLTTTCNSISRIQKVLDDQPLWHPNSTIEDVSQSQLRISWREGLMSRTIDMNENDCCRCLSEEEEDINGSSNDGPRESCE